MRNATSAAQAFAALARDRDGLEPDVIDTLVQFKANLNANRPERSSEVSWRTGPDASTGR